MATEVGKGVIPVTFDKAQIGRDLSSSIDEGARQSEGHVSSTFKRLAGLATAAFSVVAIGNFVGDSVAAARESNKVAAQTEAVIASTGGAAKLTAGDFSKLAESISLKTGIDDEQIQSGENLLATFTNIRNELGAGNDIFSQATKIAVDMGAALGGDASSNAIQLGKALNDPIRGLTALTRVGVTFSDEQRAQITTMQEHGDIVGAQKVLLAELTKEFGGSAEATATAGAKWGVFWGNLQEKFGNLLIPALDATAEWAMTTLPNAFGVLQDAVGPVIDSIITDVSMFWSTLTTGFTEDEGTGIEKFALTLRDLWPQVQAAASDAWDVLHPILVELGAFVGDNLIPILIGLGLAFAAITAPITTITVGLIVLYTRSKTFRDIVESVRHGLVVFGDGVMDVFHVLQDNLGPAFLTIGASLADLARFFADRWDKIRGSVITVLDIITTAIAVALAPAFLAWTYFHDQILAIVQLVWGQIVLQVQTAVRVIGDIFDFITSVLTGDWQGAWDAIKDILGAAVDFLEGSLGLLLTFVIDFFSSLPGNMISALGDLAGLIGGVFTRAWSAAGDAVSGGIQRIKDMVSALPGAIADLASSAFDAIPRAFRGAANTLIGAWNNLRIPSVTIGGWDPPGPGPSFPSVSTPEINFPDIPYLHAGGFFQPASGDEGLAWLQRGELVVAKSDTSAIEAALAGGGIGTRSGVNGPKGAQFNFNGPISFGSDRATTERDFDWFALTTLAGV